ncbi:hypothetical protein AVEN_61350-1 [Araneus ventricosus]|uniref:Uncharacterized protein n=1 Tax=Araneus ventricosus TaxID=182803 RepID=A0A4Y2MGY9_ARAVE|nr:hypothetical protein AVEN_61350-1 [Araneus ventricosus]
MGTKIIRVQKETINLEFFFNRLEKLLNSSVSEGTPAKPERHGWNRSGEERDTDRGEEIPLVFSQCTVFKVVMPVLRKKRTIRPARSECLIQGVPEVPGQFRYAVTNFPSQVSQKGVLVAATLR